MKAIQISVYAILSLVFSTISARACSCVEYKDIQDHIDTHDVIFLGQSTGTRTAISTFGRITLHRKTEFVITDMLKGRKLEKIEISHVDDTGGNCGITFYKGARYLVFAERDEEGKLITGLCSGTRQEIGPYEWSLKDYVQTIRKK